VGSGPSSISRTTPDPFGDRRPGDRRRVARTVEPDPTGADVDVRRIGTVGGGEPSACRSRSSPPAHAGNG
jgi:hypothetical protein